MIDPAAQQIVDVATQYARDVVDGRIVAGRYTYLACARQVQDLERSARDPSWPYMFDVEAAALPCQFIANLEHVKGEWAKRREHIRLEPFQLFGITAVYGWKHRATGLRRFRKAYEEVGRKNAKSTKIAGLSLYMLVADGEEGAEVYSAATKKDQAKIILDVARQMAKRAGPKFRGHFGVVVRAHAIAVPAKGGSFIALDAEGKTQDGLNPHFVANDEVHAQKNRALYDVLETALGSRSQPLIWNITTAGADRNGICYELRDYLIKILEGKVEDESFWGIIYAADQDDDWRDERTWRKANPNLGVSCNIEQLRDMARKAAATPAAVNNFLTKHLDLWVSSDAAWMNMPAYDKCKDASLRLADFAGETCYVGLDLASKIDFAAKVRLFIRTIDDKKHYFAFPDFYIPRARVEENPTYAGWEREGLLTVTDGNVIDFDVIEAGILADRESYAVEEVPHDPWHATQLVGHMLDAGVPMVEVPQTVKGVSEGMKEFEAAVIDGRFHHDGNKVLRWMVENIVGHYDTNNNIKPNRAKVVDKIDGGVATITAFARAVAVPAPDEGVSLPSDFDQVAAQA